MSSEIDSTGARRILAAIVENAYDECGAADEQTRKEAFQFFHSQAFKSMALVFRLNERRVRVLAGKKFSKAEEKQNEKNARTHTGKERKGQQPPPDQLG